MQKNKIVYGEYIFQDDDFKSGNLFQATSLLSSQLQVNTFDATIKCTDPAILDFERNSKLEYYYNNRLTGIFRVQKIERVGPELYSISSTSTLGLLTEGQHMGGIYTGQTAQEVIASICGTVPFIVKSNLQEIKLYGWLPIASPRDNLSQVLFAIGAALKTDLDGVLRIAGLWDGISGTVSADKMYTGAKVEYGAKITQVSLTEHQYSEGGDVKKLFEGTAQAGDIISFSSPMYSLSASGITILESGANYAKVSAGIGSLTGYEYVHSTRIITKNVQTANTPNIKTVDKATLVSLVNSQAVADRLVSFYKCQETINAPVLYQGENTGDILSTHHPFDKTAVQACLQSTDITLSNTLKAQEKSLVGFAPAQKTGMIYEDRHETIKANSTWTVPDGVTSVTAVCIGAGTGGYSGHYGSSTPESSPQSFTESDNIGGYTTQGNGYYPGQGCPGGVGGEPGAGGKIVTATIDVTPGQSIQATIGVGGNGGAKSSGSSNPGISGGATTFGSISSDSGSSSPTGYTDIVTGEKYATPGRAGINGGKGGSSTKVTQGYQVADAGESVTDRNGVVWNPGSVPAASDRQSSIKDVYSGSDYQGTASAYSGRGIGGGAAAGGNGGSGSYGSTSATTSTARATGGPGGSGGNASAPSKSTICGGGGDGGNGGGGGGGPGSCFVSKRVKNGVSLSISLYPQIGNAGPGGSGSDGGQGGDGIIILYYIVAKVAPSGQLVDKNGLALLDKTGRRFIV